ncbi:MAG: hypothetical protein LIO65_10035 [Odoribacter sp.]|nr:hypothetical protein [Odoribacter sp.]
MTLRLKNVPLYVKILAGMVVGIGLGFLANSLNGDRFIQSWIAPWGTILFVC